MSWVRIDDGFPEHQKVLEAGGDAAWLHVCALAWCNRNLTDGFIPANIVPRLSDRRTPMKHAANLQRVGLWDATEGGWVIHDYLEFQPSKARVETDRSAARKRMADARGGGSSTGSSGEVRANNYGSSHNPDPTRPDPTPTGVSTQKTDRLPTVAAVGQSVIDEALTLYGQHCHDLDPDGCITTPARRIAGIIRNAKTERAERIADHMAENPTSTVAELLASAFDLNELEVWRLTGQARRSA